MPDFRLYPVLFCCLSFILSAGSCVWGQIAPIGPININPIQTGDIRRDAGTGLHQPDRETLQNLKTADVLLSEKRYSEAVRLYWQLLQLPEDAFIDPNWERQAETVPSDNPAAETEAEQPDSQKPDQPLASPNVAEQKPVCYSSLKTYIQWRLATMCEEGREVTRIVIEPLAKQALESALTSGQTDRLAAVGKQFFPSESGVEALFLLGILELSDGQPQAALAQFDYLQRFPEISARLDPAFSLLWANCIILTGQQDSRQETLTRLRDRLQSVRWNLDTETVQGLNEQASIDQLLAAYRPKLEQFQKARFQSPLPLLSVLWRVPNYDTPLLESFLTHIYEQQNSSLPIALQGLAVLQGVFRPVVHGDLVFMRDLFELTAIDRTTGKRVWKATTQAAGAIQRRWQNQRNRMGSDNISWLSTLRQALELRVLFDKTYAALSVDESNVYTIEDIWNNQLLDARVQSIGNFFQVPAPQMGASESANRLAAYDQKTGRLLWTGGRSAAAINGAREEAFDDVSFLGAPLSYNQKLYILGESQELISLYEIDPKTGKLLWTQPLNQASASFVVRFLNLSVIECNGMLLCPLSPFSLAAVDPTNQRLLWAFDSRIEKQYTQSFFRNANAINVLAQQMKAFFQFGYQQRLFSLYRANGRILYSPMDSNVVYSLDESTGKPVRQLNTYQPCQILAVKDSTVFLLSSSRLEMDTTLLSNDSADSGLKPVTGAPLTEPSIVPGAPRIVPGGGAPIVTRDPADAVDPAINPAANPTSNPASGPVEAPTASYSHQNQTCNLPRGCVLAGDGFRYRDFLYIPASGGELLEFSLLDKKFTARVSRKDDQPMGNLVFDGEQVFSQSFLSLDAFDIRELVEGRIKQSLQEQPDSFRYLTYGAYLAWSTENWDQAAGYLLKLYARQPRPSLKLLQKFFDVVAEKSPDILDKYEKPLEEVLVSSEEKTWFLKYQTIRLAKENQVAKCLERLKLLQEIDVSGERFVTTQESGNRSLTQRSDVWLGVFLNNLYQKTDEPGRELIRQWVRDHVKELSEESDVSALNRALVYFSFLPESAAIAQRLFQKYVKMGQLNQAELVLRQLRYAPYADEAQKAQAWFQQALLLSDLKPEDAAIALRQISRLYPQEILFPMEEQATDGKPADGQTVDQYVQNLPTDSPVRKAYLQPRHVWPTGDLVGVEEKSENALDQQNRALDSNRMVTFTERYPFLNGLTARLNVQPPQKLIFRDSFGRQKMSFPVDSQQQQGRIVIRSQSASARSPWWAAEHLFIFSGKNGELSAVNYLSRRPAVVWEQEFAPETSDEDPWSLVQNNDQVFTNALPQSYGVYANTILFCYGANQAIGVDLQTGAVKWRRTIPVNCGLCYANDRYFLVSEASVKSFGTNDKTYPFATGIRVRKYSIETGAELDTDKTIYFPNGAELTTGNGCVYYKEYQTVVNQETVKRSIGLYSPDEQKNRWTKTIERKSEANGLRSIEPTVYEKEKLVVINNPNGEVEILDLYSGKTLVKTQVEAIPAEERNKMAQQYEQFQLRKKQNQNPGNVPQLPQFIPVQPANGPNRAAEEGKPTESDQKSDQKQPMDGDAEEPIPSFMPGIQKRTLLQPYTRTFVLRDGGDILLIAYNNTEFFQNKNIVISQFYPSSPLNINRGQLYRFNSEGKMVWSKPIPIERQFYYTIADDLPFLMLGRNYQSRVAQSNNQSMTGQILLIDKKTGVQWKYEVPEALSFVDVSGSPDSNSIRIVSSVSAPVDFSFVPCKPSTKREPGDLVPIPVEKAEK